jgi:hypothetical protein
MRLRCTQCLSEITERVGFETPGGEALCGPCYFALWGPKGSRTLSAESETARPRSRRPRTLRTFWMPGPTGETDPSPIPRRRHR